jgi:glycosyltransferase involved in cell wall biosynthesis
MKVLTYANSLVLPPTNGIWLKQYYLYRTLSSSHEINVAVPASERAGTLEGVQCEIHRLDPGKGMKSDRSINRLNLGVPLRVQRSVDSRTMNAFAALRRRIKPDVIQVDSINHVELAREGTDGAVRVLSINDAESLAYATQGRIASSLRRKLTCALQTRWFRNYESKIMKHYDVTVVVSERDADYLRRLDATVDIRCIQLGVDTEYFHPNPQVQPRPDQIIFVGNLTFPPNRDAIIHFYRDVFPLVRDRVLDVRLVIVGKNPPPEVLQLGNDPSVRVTGYVDDIRPFLWESSVAVVPTRSGAGMKIKILEALALGIPVCAYRSALHGQEALPRLCLVTSSPVEMAELITRVLKDPEMHRTRSRDAVSKIRNEFSWEKVASQYGQLYAEIRERRGIQRHEIAPAQ